MMKKFSPLEIKYADNTSNIVKYEKKNNFKISENITDIIHDDMQKIMIDDDYALFLHKKISSKEKIIRELLTYDLLNYTPKTFIDKFEDLFMYTVNTLKKYQYKVGGFNLEDKDWIIGDSNNQRFKIKNNQKILYNTTDKKFCDKELVWFLDSIISYIQKSINNKNFTIKYTWVEDCRHSLCWIIFILTDKTVHGEITQ